MLRLIQVRSAGHDHARFSLVRARKREVSLRRLRSSPSPSPACALPRALSPRIDLLRQSCQSGRESCHSSEDGANLEARRPQNQPGAPSQARSPQKWHQPGTEWHETVALSMGGVEEVVARVEGEREGMEGGGGRAGEQEGAPGRRLLDLARSLTRREVVRTFCVDGRRGRGLEGGERAERRVRGWCPRWLEWF